MEITAFVEVLDDGGFRATSLIPVQLMTEGTTREQALARLKDLIRDRFFRGEVVQLQVPLIGEQQVDWDEMEHEELMREIREYRRQVDADPNRL